MPLTDTDYGAVIHCCWWLQDHGFSACMHVVFGRYPMHDIRLLLLRVLVGRRDM